MEGVLALSVPNLKKVLMAEANLALTNAREARIPLLQARGQIIACQQIALRMGYISEANEITDLHLNPLKLMFEAQEKLK